MSETTTKDDEWHKAMIKIFPFLDQGSNGSTVMSEFPPNVLMEVVSARGLTSIKGVDPYCLVRVGHKEVHRTKIIWNDPDPIWTILTGSLCLLRIPPLDCKDETGEDEQQSVIVEVNHGNQCIGIVTIPFKDVLVKTGEREEFSIRLKSGTKSDNAGEDDLGTLALRFRPASDDDINFFKTDQPGNVKTAHAGIDFKKGAGPNRSARKKGTDGRVQYRTQPYADSDRVEETTWLTKDQLHDEALKPSTKWIEAGYGDVGRVYVEIIGCDNLVNLDVGVNDHTDTFTAIVFEDSLVRTDVIHDCLQPRWMPWSSRAFAFNIVHPSSLLFFGVFDYDELGAHDPIGRLAINTFKFQSNTTYLLHYRLRNNEIDEDDRGTITIRLRVEWKNESEAIRKTFTPAPRFLINVPSEKSLELVRYMCRGSVNVAVASVDSVKLLAKALVEYGSVVCYLIDVLICIWLWRGKAKVCMLGKEYKFWFPIHSAFVFVAAVLAVEFPLKIPAILFYTIGWALLSIGYHSSTHPDPWQRSKTFGELTMISIFGRSTQSSIQIQPNIGVSEAETLKKLDKVKADRVAAFIYDFMMVGLKVRRIYKKTEFTNIDIATEDKAGWSILGNNLYYVHLALYYMVTYLNMFRNYVNWRSHGAYFLSIELLALGTIFLIFPMQRFILWAARIFVWIFLGPLMKAVDVYVVGSHYRARDELEADPEFHGTNLESVLVSDRLQVMVQNGRLSSEEALKLKAMREYKFGRLSQHVPAFDTQCEPSIPLPKSSAQPYLGSKGDPKKGFVDVESDKIKWTYVAGQNLTGTMVCHHVTAADKCNDTTPEKLNL